MKVTVIKVSMLEGKGYDAMKPLLFAIIDKITPNLNYSSALDNIDSYTNLKSGLYDPFTGKYSEYPRP